MVGHDKVFIIRNHTTILHTVPNLRFLSKKNVQYLLKFNFG